MTRHKTKRARLEAAGWRFGSARELLDLSDEDVEFIEIKLALADALKARRQADGLTQAQCAERVGSSQSRVARMEAADPTVTLDLLIKALLALGATRRDIAAILGRRAA